MAKSHTAALLGSTAIASLMLATSPAASTDFFFTGYAGSSWSNPNNWVTPRACQ